MKVAISDVKNNNNNGIYIYIYVYICQSKRIFSCFKYIYLFPYLFKNTASLLGVAHPEFYKNEY